MTNTLRDRMRREMAEKEIFRRAEAHAFAYADGVAGRMVFPGAEALAGLDAFDEPLAEGGSDPLKVLDMLDTHGSPATTAQLGGRYFGFVNGGAIPVGLAARWLADFWDQNAALHVMSPVAATLEGVAERWLVDLFGLPQDTAAGFVSGTTQAIVTGLAAGRWRIAHDAGWDINAKGMQGAPPIRIVTGAHTHSAVLRAIGLLGFGTENVELVEVDDQGRIRLEAMPPLDASCLVILQAGNVNSGSFDPIDAICDLANAAGAWVHVDGAFGLWAETSASLRHLTRGIAKAHSFSVDGHKTLNTPYDSGIALCADREALHGALQATGSYLLFGESRDGMQVTPEMSRRARGIEIWAILKYLGRSGVDELVTGLQERAVQMGEALKGAGFEVLNDVVFNQVIVASGSDEETRALLARVQDDGTCWVGGSTWFGRSVIRISICSWMTEEADIRQTVEAFVAARDAMTGTAG
ncbi:aspartate aminotransferase family protein [Rhodobacteraceae bacterium NNCM2]|nr:aspartate aminotransferase family protein [Coraliihabitans acroporae]